MSGLQNHPVSSLHNLRIHPAGVLTGKAEHATTVIPTVPVTVLPEAPDVINSPAHYARGRFEVWDIIEHFKLNYNIGNVAKYILRAGVKTQSPVQDYKKAIAYLQREVDILEGRLDVRPE